MHVCMTWQERERAEARRAAVDEDPKRAADFALAFDRLLEQLRAVRLVSTRRPPTPTGPLMMWQRGFSSSRSDATTRVSLPSLLL